MTTSNYLELEGAVGALVMSSWKHCLALSGSSKVISEALPEPGTRNSSSRSSLQYQGPAAAAQRCEGHPEAVASTELRRRGVRSALTHSLRAAGLGWGDTMKTHRRDALSRGEIQDEERVPGCGGRY